VLFFRPVDSKDLKGELCGGIGGAKAANRGSLQIKTMSQFNASFYDYLLEIIFAD
jgi:hypothetical protein